MICDVCSSPLCYEVFSGFPTYYRCKACGSDTAEKHDFVYTSKYNDHILQLHDDEYMIKDHTTNVDLLRQHVSEGSAVLDVGSFKGFGMEALRRRKMVPYGFDVFEYLTKEKNVVVSASISHSLWSIKFDAIMCREVLEHVGNWQSCLLEMRLALKDKGVLMIQTPVPTNERHPIPHQQGHFRVFSHAALRKYVETIGFNITDAMVWDAGQLIVGQMV